MPDTVEGVGLPWERTFVENVTRARKAADMSQTELGKRIAAKGLPFHQQTVQRIENGSRPVRLNEAVVIAEVLYLEFPDVMMPKTAERATETFAMQMGFARREWESIGVQMSDLAERVDSEKQGFFTERSFYVRTMQGVAEQHDAAFASEADGLIERMRAVQTALLRLLVEEFPHIVEEMASSIIDASALAAARGKVFGNISRTEPDNG